MFYWLLTYFYSINMYLYKYLLFFYNYITKYNEIKFIKNNNRISNITNLKLKNNEQLTFNHKNKTFSLIKKDYNETSYIIGRIYDQTKKISITKILLIKEIEYDNDNKHNYNQDEILKFILMYYGPINDLYNNEYKIKLKDIRDNKNNELNIKRIKFVDNNFLEKELLADDYLI